MKHLIKFFSLIAFFAIIGSNLSYGQTSDDYYRGNFTLPSYEQDERDNSSERTMWAIVFDDDEQGFLYYNKSCGKYYIKEAGFSEKTFYPDKTTALKALYGTISGKNESGYLMKGQVYCD